MAKDTAKPASAAVDTRGFLERKKLSPTDLGKRLPTFGDRRKMFYLSHHHSSFELVQIGKDWRLVPTLNQLIVSAGVNFTPPAEKEGAGLDVTPIESKFRAKFGHVVLLDQDDYMGAVDGADGRGYFLNWEKVRSYDDGDFEIELDAEGYDTWRYSLITSGKLAPPREGVINQFRTRLKRAVQRATRTPHLAHAQEAKAEAERRLAGLEEAVKALASIHANPKLPAAPAVES